MQITYVLELLNLTKRKREIIDKNIHEVYKNRISISKELGSGKTKLSTKDFKEKLPSVVINQNIREVKSLYKSFKKSSSSKDNLDFKTNQPLCYNNQNYRIENHFVSFPLYTDKTKRYWFPIVRNEGFNRLWNYLNNGGKLGKSSLFKKKEKYYLGVTISIKVENTLGDNIMGIDIGLNQLAVGSIQDIKGIEINRMFYNGKEAGFIRRKYRSIRRSLGQNKKLNKIKEIEDKESRYIRNLNHKISRLLVNLAVQEKVTTIVMEDLKNIRKDSYFSKGANRNLNSWSFYELQSFIHYKAELEGLKVVYINPKYTSQICNQCNKIKRSNRNRNVYSCNCGYRVHADLNAARNICRNLQKEKEKSA